MSKNQKDGIMPGSVTWKNWLSFTAPSIADASYKDSGIF